MTLHSVNKTLFDAPGLLRARDAAGPGRRAGAAPWRSAEQRPGSAAHFDFGERERFFEVFFGPSLMAGDLLCASGERPGKQRRIEINPLSPDRSYLSENFRTLVRRCIEADLCDSILVGMKDLSAFENRNTHWNEGSFGIRKWK